MRNVIHRQGDVLIRRIDSLPTQKAAKRDNGILAYGEVTGHAHRVEELEKAEVLELGNDLYLRVVTIQREYTPAEIRNVAD